MKTMAYLVSRLSLRSKLDLAGGALGESEGAVLSTVGDSTVQVGEIDRNRCIDAKFLSDVLRVHERVIHVRSHNHLPS